MKGGSLVFLLCFFGFITLSTQQAKKPSLCREGLSTLSVRDHPILDIQSWDKLKKKHDIFLVGISDSSCESCCQTEGLLSDFQSLGLKHKGKLIPIVRVDIAKKTSKAVLDKEDIQFDAVPRVVMVRDGRFYSYDSPFDRVDLLVHHMNRLLNPIISLQTEEDVIAFLGLSQIDTNDDEKNDIEFWQGDYNTTFLRQLKTNIPSMDEHWRSMKLKTRAVCFLYDKQEYREELAAVRHDARFLSTRENLRIGLVVDNQRLIKKLKSNPHYGARLFPAVSMSALVLRRYDGVFKVHDITGDDHVSPHQFINKQSLKEVEELHSESYRVQELLRQPMFLAFVDFEDPQYSKECYKAVQVLKEVAPKYSHILGFFYVNNTMMWQRKRVLGVTWDELPAMAFNMLTDVSKVMPYPRGREISKVALFDFFDDLFTGRKAQGESVQHEYQVPTDFSKTKNDTEIETVFLNNTLIATRSNFSELVYQEGYDVMLLLFTTEVAHNAQRAVALQVNLVADALKKLGSVMKHSMRVVAYDVNVNAFPEGIDFTLDLPQILFIPAYNKRPPYKKYTTTGQPAIAGPLLLWAQRVADVSFVYPVDVSRLGYPRNDTNTQQENNNDKSEGQQQDFFNDDQQQKKPEEETSRSGQNQNDEL